MEKATPRNPLPYITKSPLDYLKNGEVRRVPWMVGFVRNEGVLKAKGMICVVTVTDDSVA